MCVCLVEVGFTFAMGRCLGCKKQTQNFCYVDQEFVCPSCLITTNVHGRCVVGSYRGWVQDSAYKWPPSCVICSEDILTDQGIQRLPCFGKRLRAEEETKKKKNHRHTHPNKGRKSDSMEDGWDENDVFLVLTTAEGI